MRRTPPLIVGGGPAGAAAAIRLAEGGARPMMIERKTRAEGIVCGGFLSWDALANLERLGVSATSLGAHRIDRVRIVVGARAVEARLPGRAAGLSRAMLDEALLARAAGLGVEVRRGVGVTRIGEGGVDLADGAALDAETIFVATGKHALRGSPREGAPPGSVGFRTDVRAPADLHGVIELHPFRGGYAGVLVQEDGRANLCLSVAADRLRAAGGRPEGLLAALGREAPRLLDRLDDPGAWASIAAVPYGWRAPATEPGRFRLGDQAAVIASVVGDGTGIALASGASAAAAWLRGEDAPAWQRAFARRAARPLAIAELARGLAERAPLRLAGLARIPGVLALAARLTRIGV